MTTASEAPQPDERPFNDADETSDRKHPRRTDPDEAGLMPWLKLMRLPTVFTALSNVLCGYLITSPVELRRLPFDRTLWMLLACSAGLYLSGMVLNDVFDAQLDSEERPERPIPSGQISRRAAAIFGSLLMGLGILAGGTVGTATLITALGLAACVIAYDRFLKATIAGPLAMGSCGVSVACSVSGSFVTW